MIFCVLFHSDWVTVCIIIIIIACIIIHEMSINIQNNICDPCCVWAINSADKKPSRAYVVATELAQ